MENGNLAVDQALSYEPVPTEDLFRADEALERSWIALRTEVLEMGDRRLIRLLREFAQAIARHSQLVRQREQGKAAAHGAAPVLIRSE